MSLDEKIACFINTAFGAGVGFAIYFFFLGGFRFLLTSKGAYWGNGWISFFVCVGGGGYVGFLSYRNRMKAIDIDSSGDTIYSGHGGAGLLWRRVAVIIFGIIGAYYVWQMAK